MSASYINPALPSMIRGLYRADLREKSIQNMLDLAADLVQELIEVRAAALAEQGTEEREWEYRVVNKGYASESHETVELARREAGCEAGDAIERRRKAGPWMPVAQGKTTETEEEP